MSARFALPIALVSTLGVAIVIGYWPVRLWHEGWLDLMADDAKAGVTGESVAISAPTRVEIEGENAYVVVPAVYSFKDHGAAMSESAQMTYALHKGAAGWKIAAWTWTGPRASPAH